MLQNHLKYSQSCSPLLHYRSAYRANSCGNAIAKPPAFYCSPLLCYRFVSTTLTAQIPNGNAIAKPQALLHAGKERDSETGFSYFGARYYDSDLMTGWLSVDPMADKYPNISPYAYCAWNPVKLVDPDGEEIDISALSENMQNRLVNSLCYITGLKLTINNGKIEYSKDNLGNAIFENGSVSARNDLIAAIEAKNKDGSNYVIEVGPHLSSKGGVNDNGLGGTIYLYWDLKERYDKQTNGIGMIFMHELGHAFFGDKDPEPDGRLRYALNGDIIDRRLGEAVTRVNKYRSELNLPIRATYIPNLEGYVPFLETIQCKNGKTKTREIYLWME